jgi:ribosomal protein S18 acetylase RimI-like enzyme
LNFTIVQAQESIPSDNEIEKAIDFFENRELPFIWWTEAQKLEERGFQCGGILTGIAMDVSSATLPEYSFPFNLQVKRVHADEEIKLFSKILVTGMGMDPGSIEQFHNVLLPQEEQVHFLALIDECPVGVVTLYTGRVAAGVWNLATLPEYRRCGVGTALVHAALTEARKRDYKHVMAILMPKGMAWGIFTKMGFKEVCRFPFYVYGSSGELEK